MGRLHSRAYANVVTHLPDLQVAPRLVAAADPSEQARADALDILSFERAYADYRELLADLKVGAVSIAPLLLAPRDRHGGDRSRQALLDRKAHGRQRRTVSRSADPYDRSMIGGRGAAGHSRPLLHTLICLDKYSFFVILIATGNTRRRFYRDS